MKIDLTKVLKTLKSEVYKDSDNKDLTLGGALAVILDRATEGGKHKMFILAKKCATEKTLELDSVDFNLIKNAVEKTTVFTSNVVVGQILDLLDAN